MEKQEESKELQVATKQQPQALVPMTPEDAVKMMELYQAYQTALLDKSDYQAIQGKDFKKKSAWRKLAMANNLSVRVVDERREELPNGDYAYHFVCEATHPNGRITSGSGSCTAYEKAQWKNGKWMIKNYEAQPNSLHNVRSTAETRAWNRAVSNMIAAGEVSAEEADQEHNSYIDVEHTTTQPVEKPVQLQQNSVDKEIKCPSCGGPMWDNRVDKKNPNSPDYVCKQSNGECLNEKGYKTSMWEPKEEKESDEVINLEDVPF